MFSAYDGAVRISDTFNPKRLRSLTGPLAQQSGSDGEHVKANSSVCKLIQGWEFPVRRFRYGLTLKISAPRHDDQKRRQDS
jgi:hypothetical protein